MSKRGAGVAFCGIAAFLLGVRHLSAAIMASARPGANAFRHALEESSAWPMLLGLAAMVIGLLYILQAEREERRSRGG